MTLSAIAYEHRLTTFNQLLENKSIATKGEWELVWGPAQKDDKAFSAYVVRHQTSGDYTIAIRGSVLSEKYIVETIIDWRDNFEVFSLLPFSDDPGQGTVSHGMSKAFHAMLEMRDPATHQSLLNFISAANPETLYVTGHSLGACIASIVCGWMRNQLKQTRTIAYTFAGASAGDAQFAAFVGQKDFHRYWNEWDFVPQAFQGTTMMAALEWYPFPGRSMSTLDRFVVKALINMIPHPIPYMQPCGDGIRLKSEVFRLESFTAQIGAQHDHNYYLQLLGAPPVNIAHTMTS